MTRKRVYLLVLGQDGTPIAIGDNTKARIRAAANEVDRRERNGENPMVLFAPGVHPDWKGVKNTFASLMNQYWMRLGFYIWTSYNATEGTVWGTLAEIRWAIVHIKNLEPSRKFTLVLVADRRHLKRAVAMALSLAADMGVTITVETVKANHPSVPLLHEMAAWVKFWVQTSVWRLFNRTCPVCGQRGHVGSKGEAAHCFSDVCQGYTKI